MGLHFCWFVFFQITWQRRTSCKCTERSLKATQEAGTSGKKENKHGWYYKKKEQQKKKQGYMRDSEPIKRSLLSRLSIRNHLSQATSSTQWLMGLHRPRVPAHYLVHTELLFKHKGRNMKHCFLGCHSVKIFYLFLVSVERVFTIFVPRNTQDIADQHIN